MGMGRPRSTKTKLIRPITSSRKVVMAANPTIRPSTTSLARTGLVTTV